MPILLVGGGGCVGSVLRYLVGLSAQRYSGSFLHGTLWVNLLGCLAIGVISTLAATTSAVSPNTRLLLATGFCGGFTTMSSFTYELSRFLRDEEYASAAGYFGLTFCGCVVMFYAGTFLVKLVLKG